MASSPLEVQFQNRFRVVSGGQWAIIVSSTSRSWGGVFSVSILALTVVDGVVLLVVVGAGVVVLLLLLLVDCVVEGGGGLRGSGVAERSRSQGGMAWLVVDWASTESQV